MRMQTHLSQLTPLLFPRKLGPGPNVDSKGDVSDVSADGNTVYQLTSANELWALDATTLSWSQISINPTNAPATGLDGRTMNVIGTKAYVFGGGNQLPNDDAMYILDWSSQPATWSVIAAGMGSPTARKFHTSVVIGTEVRHGV